jgi:hypothetical protein
VKAVPTLDAASRGIKLLEEGLGSLSIGPEVRRRGLAL